MFSLRSIRPSWSFLFFFLLLGLACAAYWPGLGGPFLLDDWGTLPKLGAYGPVDNFTTFISYLTSGTAGPSGRPLALLSFLIDARNWPATPWLFKLTNLILHLLNGLVLAWLLVQLGKAYGLVWRKAAWAAVIGAGIWLIHPLFVSTTLYVVQRMAMLAAFFVFAGLGCYVTGRLRLSEGHTRRGYALMTGGIIGGTLLGFFSKEDAALLPLLALVLEFTILRKTGLGIGPPSPVTPQTGSARPEKNRLTTPGTPPAKTHWLVFRVVFLWLPSTFIIGYLLWRLRDIGVVVPGRDFSIGMRLMTECRVLVHYLYLLVIPHAWTHGLYTTIPVSRNLFQPWTTLPSIILILALAGAAATMRKRWPALAAAILFFFAGQLLESTTIPLELYYEHRNYMPAALLFWPLALWFVQGPGTRALRRVTLVLALALLLILTGMRANLWGQPTRLALNWMRLNPDSSRAIVTGAEAMENRGHNLAAYLRLFAASHKLPKDASIALARLSAACRLGKARPVDVHALLYAAGHSLRGVKLLYQNLPQLMNHQGSPPPCTGVTNQDLSRILNNADKNKHFQRPADQEQLALLRGQLLLAEHRSPAAYKAFLRALKLVPTPDVALTTSSWLLNAKHPRAAERLLNRYKEIPRRRPTVWNMQGLHRRWLEHIGWYEESFRNIRHAIKEASSRKPQPQPQSSAFP